MIQLLEERVRIVIFYRDVDNDGYGNADLMLERCIGIDGYVTDNTDCDDTKFHVDLGRNEICDGIDNDCDDWLMTVMKHYRNNNVLQRY